MRGPVLTPSEERFQDHFEEPREWAQMVKIEGRIGIKTPGGDYFELSETLYNQLQKNPVHTRITTNELLEKTVMPRTIAQKGMDALFEVLATQAQQQTEILKMLSQLVGTLAKK